MIDEVECQLMTGSGCAFRKDANGVKKSGDVVRWGGDDFDRIDVIKIEWSGPRATLETKSEGMSGQPETCPQIGGK
jgi:hypothetical protein